MSFSRTLPAILLLTLTTSLSSCQFGRKIDVVNPTVAELDSLDMQWGLEARKSRGGPRRNYQYAEPTGGSVTPAAAQPSVSPVPARENVSGPPPVSLNPEPPASAPVVAPSNLR